MGNYLTFYKTQDNKWFVDLPEWEGAIEELQMVCGADTLLDIISQGEDSVRLFLSLEPQEGCDILDKLYDTPDVGGSYYILLTYKGIEYDLEMWLCGVTEFVFGFMPDKIYFK